MNFWIIYIISSFLMSYLISTFFSKKNGVIIFYLLLAIFITPQNLGIGAEKTAPAFFSFIFDLIFEQNASIRVLRSLVFSLPLAFILTLLFLRIKKRLS